MPINKSNKVDEALLVSIYEVKKRQKNLVKRRAAMNKLTEYIISLTNLYGMVDRNKVVEIYNMQNEEHIAYGDVGNLLSNMLKELEKYFEVTEQYNLPLQIMGMD